MGIYNVKLFTYANGKQQFRVYANPVRTGDDTKQSQQKRLETIKEHKSSSARTLQQEQRSKEQSMNRTKKSIYEIARSNNWDYFITFTFNPQKINSKNYDFVVKSLKDFMYNLKKNYAPVLVYLLVPELHKDGEKWHFHGLLSNTANIRFTDSGKRKNGNIIYNMSQYKFGFSTVSKVQNNDAVCHYITKYITKELCNMTQGKKRYWVSKNAQRPLIQEENMLPEEIDGLFHQFRDSVTYVKTLDVPIARQQIKYVEME